LAGTTFGKYRLIELLGRGGMGEVWRAYDTALDRVVAIKILPAGTSADLIFQQRFRREAHAAARLNSPHVIPIHTHGEIAGRLFVDMRLIDGRDLQSLLASGPPLAPRRAVHVVEQVARALHAAHRVGLLHRDVKPSNILLDDDDFAYLIDFGVARTAGEMSLTTAGEVIGTSHFMAPERFTDDHVDARSDVYALACVLYECLTGRHPFPGDSFEQQLTAHLNDPPPRPSDVNPGLPRGFDAVIATGMAKRPDQRYPSAMDLAQAARDAVATASAPPRNAATAAAPAWWRRTPVLIAAAAVAVVATVLAVGVAVTDGGSSQRPTQQSTLPFTDLDAPEGLSVDNGGTVYVADPPHNRILALAAGSASQAVLPFDGLNHPTGVTADQSGSVYVTDAGSKQVVILPAGATQQSLLPFTDLADPTGVTVDSSRTVYVTDTGRNQVVALTADSSRQTVLPFTGLSGPTGVVVNSNGTVYVADGGNDRVLALPADSGTQSTLPFTGLRDPGGVTVDGAGAVYVTDRGHDRVLKLPVGSTVQTELPFTGLDRPWGLAVDSMGTVYVAGNNAHVFALRQ
jgi:serine/threonine-protein kinase